MLKHSQIFLTTTRVSNFVRYFYINISCHVVWNLLSKLKTTICNSWNLYLLYLPIFFAIKRRRICFLENVEYLNLIGRPRLKSTTLGKYRMYNIFSKNSSLFKKKQVCRSTNSCLFLLQDSFSLD